ncbi:MAG: YqiA/YcfP family alpha/beta fold hydrolase [Candidatus Sericytochromatia bacterium]
MFKILYLHGLDSFLNDEKRNVLEKYGEVLAPNIDYRSNSNIYDLFLEEIKKENIDVIIGSSMGGLIAYYLSHNTQKPSLLFNPALPYQSVLQIVDKGNIDTSSELKYIILGKKDIIVKYSDNIDFLNKNIHDSDNVEIKIINKLEHRIPTDIFEKEVFNFFKELK